MDAEMRSEEMNARIDKAHEEVGPLCEGVGDSVRSVLARLRAGVISEESARESLQTLIDTKIYAATRIESESSKSKE